MTENRLVATYPDAFAHGSAIQPNNKPERRKLMGLIALIILILFLLGLLVVIGAAYTCRGQASTGPSESPVNNVIHVRVSAITCRSFSVQFETENPVKEVSGRIKLTADIAQTIAAS